CLLYTYTIRIPVPSHPHPTRPPSDLCFGASQYHTHEQPRGSQTYVITPDATRGNFFESSARRAGRQQFIASLALPPLRKFGRHDVKLGTDLDQVSTDESFSRNPFVILREDSTLARQASFIGNPAFEKDNFEAAVYVEDRWSPSDRLLIEP